MSFFKGMMKAARKVQSSYDSMKRSIDRALQVVDESLEIYRTSQKRDTRLSRLDVAIDNLAFLIKEYSIWPAHDDWKKRHADLVAERGEFFMSSLEEFVKDAVAKINEGKTAKTKANRAQKLIEALQKERKDKACDKAWVDAQVRELQLQYPAPPEK